MSALQAAGPSERPFGLSAFVRCRNEEEYIVASVKSSYRVFDEVVVILNESTDGTRALLEDLLPDHPKLRILEYTETCAPIGPGYLEAVAAKPTMSLARYYNWCLEQTTYSHVCKWDGDMIATPDFGAVRSFLPTADVVMFDGWDVLGEHTTDLEARIFRFDTSRARYEDWELYEVLKHDYTETVRLDRKCYLHMKLVKREWLHRKWTNPNLLAIHPVPETGGTRPSHVRNAKQLLRRTASVLRKMGKRAGRALQS
ncbi:MAG: glycosyltransferase [Thermoanaerobaculia bacterium]|mgnify:FL=1